jgi:hypothetical protein
MPLDEILNLATTTSFGEDPVHFEFGVRRKGRVTSRAPLRGQREGTSRNGISKRMAEKFRSGGG